MHYDVRGPEGAPYALVLPGAATAMWVYEPLRDRWMDQFQVLTLSYRGMGQSRNDLWQFDPTTLAEDVLAVLDHAGIEKTHAACYSLGTLVLAELLKRDPNRFDRCAIGCMPVIRGQLDAPDLMKDGYPEEITRLYNWAAVRPMTAGLFFSKWFREKHPKEYAAFVKQGQNQSPKELLTSMQQFGGTLGHDWHCFLAYDKLGPGQRLFLFGETDYLAPVRNLKLFPMSAKGPTVVFRESGHIFFLEQADSYCKVVGSFWKTGKVPQPLPGDGMVVRLEDWK